MRYDLCTFYKGSTSLGQGRGTDPYLRCVSFSISVVISMLTSVSIGYVYRSSILSYGFQYQFSGCPTPHTRLRHAGRTRRLSAQSTRLCTTTLISRSVSMNGRTISKPEAFQHSSALFTKPFLTWAGLPSGHGGQSPTRTWQYCSWSAPTAVWKEP
jgi:hypothetical protein